MALIFTYSFFCGVLGMRTQFSGKGFRFQDVDYSFGMDSIEQLGSGQGSVSGSGWRSDTGSVWGSGSGFYDAFKDSATSTTTNGFYFSTDIDLNHNINTAIGRDPFPTEAPSRRDETTDGDLLTGPDIGSGAGVDPDTEV